MTLSFPNGSRSFDASRQGVRFTAYDGMFEVEFLVEEAALRGAQTSLSQKACLAAFDNDRARIQAAAIRIYRGRANTIYRIGVVELR